MMHKYTRLPLPDWAWLGSSLRYKYQCTGREVSEKCPFEIYTSKVKSLWSYMDLKIFIK